MYEEAQGLRIQTHQQCIQVSQAGVNIHNAVKQNFSPVAQVKFSQKDIIYLPGKSFSRIEQEVKHSRTQTGY